MSRARSVHGGHEWYCVASSLLHQNASQFDRHAEFPCGILSPLANVDDPGLTDPNGGVSGLESAALEDLRQSIAAVRAQRVQQKALDDDKPNYIFGGSENRRNGKQMLPARRTSRRCRAETV